MLILAPLAGLLLACKDDAPKDSGWPPPEEQEEAPDPGPEGHAYQSFTGEARFQSAWDADPDARDCDLYWDLSGTPAELCPDCLWTFDVDFSWDESRGSQEIDCFEGAPDTGWTWTLGLSLDWYDFGVPVLWYYVESYEYYAYWYPLWIARWEYPALTFGDGSYEYEVLEDGESMYYTLYWNGTATVQ